MFQIKYNIYYIQCYEKKRGNINNFNNDIKKIKRRLSFKGNKFTPTSSFYSSILIIILDMEKCNELIYNLQYYLLNERKAVYDRNNKTFGYFSFDNIYLKDH